MGVKSLFIRTNQCHIALKLHLIWVQCSSTPYNIESSCTELVEQGQDEGTARLLGEARLQKLDLRGRIARLLLQRLQGGLRGPLPKA